MKRITYWLLSTITALVLLFGYHTSTGAEGSTSVVATDAPGRTATESGGTRASSGGTPSPSSGASGTTTVTGDAVATRFGDVQVAITVTGGKIVTSRVTTVPWSNGRDQQINSYAVPILNREAVAAQSADIDMVSGATYTSAGYQQSLQSAIDKVHLS